MHQDASTARDALQRHAWEEAVEALQAVEGAGGTLAPDELELLAAARWWTGSVDDAVEALERAFTGYLDQDRPDEAAVVALRLAELAMVQQNAAIGGGWIARAERLLEGRPEGVAHGWLAFLRSLIVMLGHGDFEAAERHAEESLRLARAHGSLDVESLALSAKAQVLLRTGRWSEGLALVDEATAVAASGRLDPKNACDVYCFTISACTDIGAYRRAGEWIDRADLWMKRRSITGYRGVCRVHRAELKRLRGEWVEAEREAQEACLELERFRMLEGVGYARYEVGEVRLRMGDYEAALEAYEQAYAYGRVPQPGLSLLLLARGEAHEAAASIAASLSEAEHPWMARDKLMRTRLLSAQVEIALAVGDAGTAGAASAELAAIAREYESEVFAAADLWARGRLALHEGAPADAVGLLGQAWRLYQRIDLPYESARARFDLGRAWLASGNVTLAHLELRAAAAVFERLGAAPDLRAVRALLEPERVDEPRVETKTFMFTDIVRSTALAGAMDDEDWHALMRWHDQALGAVIDQHRGSVVRHTGDGFFASFDRPEDALAGAVAIQRALRAHRRDTGFALHVRVGLHTTSATRHGEDYTGLGVHVAARVAGLAGSDEILVTGSLVDLVPDAPAADRRAESLKGVEEPVDVWSLAWNGRGLTSAARS